MLALLRTECINKKRLLSDDEFCTGVAIGQMVPGPFVPHYCQYIGYHLFGLKGAIAGVIALLLPCFILMLILSWLYFTYSKLPGVEQIFKGIGAVMTSIILWASYDMGKVLIKDIKDIVVLSFALILFLIKFDPALAVLICGGLKILLDNAKIIRGLFFVVPLFIFDGNKSLDLAGIFLKIGSIIFGGGYAAIPFIRNEVCNLRPWLTQKEFLDGVALAQATPGPVAITATFVGFKAMGLLGAFIATICIFLPSFIMILILQKVYQKFANNKYVISFFSGVKSAVIAILLSTGIFFIKPNWFNIPYGIFGVGGLIVLILWKVEPIFLILAGLVFGLLVG